MARHGIVGLALCAVVMGCGDDATGPSYRFIIHAVSPAVSVGTVGATTAQEPTVKVTDRAGRPMANVPVRFVLLSDPEAPAGSIANTEDITDVNGIASAGEWILSVRAGANFLAISVEGARQHWLQVTGEPEAAVALGWDVEKEDAIGFRGMQVKPPVAHARDRFGNSVPGVALTFALAEGQGTLEGAHRVTTNEGASALSWTLGEDLGANTLTASAAGLASIEYAVEVVDPIAIYDLTTIDDVPLSESHVESAFIGFTADGRFVSNGYTASTSGQRSVWSESGTFTESDDAVLLSYAGAHLQEMATLSGEVLLLVRYDDDEFSTSVWRYILRR